MHVIFFFLIFSFFVSFLHICVLFQIAEMLLQQLHTTLSCSKQIHFHSPWLLGYCVSRSLSLSLLQCWTCLWKGPQMGSGIWQCVDSCLLGKQRPVVIGMHWPHSRCGYWCHHSPLNASATQCQGCHLIQDWTLKVKSFPKFVLNMSHPTASLKMSLKLSV